MKLLALAVALVAARPAAAAVSVAAELSRARLTMGEQAVLSITVSGDQASLPSPKLPALDSFSVFDTGRSQNLSFVNGRMTAAVVYTYALSPRAPGKYKIPPISADGAAAPTAPLDIEVVPPGATASVPDAAPPASPEAPAPRPRAGRPPELRVIASVDKPRAFVNQQVTLTVRFLYAAQLIGDSHYDPPDLTGFLTEDLPPPRNGTTVVDGRQYSYTEVKLALFPLEAGRLKIGPATVHCQVARMGGGTGDDFFDRFFAMAAPQPIALTSEPIFVTVDPLPPGKPADFSGVVGRLSARASADRTSVKAGDAVALTVVVAGQGDLKTVPEPRKPDLPALRFFETESSAAVDKTGDRVGGTKTFKTVAVPRASGKVRVPPFSFSYFDPERKAYARAETAPIDLSVAPGAAVAEATGAAPVAPVAPGLTAIADDIRYLKTAPERAPVSAALSAFADLGPWHALPFAALLLSLGLEWRRRRIDADPRGRRFREALARAEERLRAAAALPDSESARAAAVAEEALIGFVADKLDARAAGLTLKAALDGLRALGTPPSPASLDRLRAAWEEADLRRFAPGAAGDARAFAAELAVLLKSLDSEMRR